MNFSQFSRATLDTTRIQQGSANSLVFDSSSSLYLNSDDYKGKLAYKLMAFLEYSILHLQRFSPQTFLSKVSYNV